MPEKDFYLLIALSIIAGLWLIQIITGRTGRHRKSRRLERDSDGLFSFEYICETLRLHPDYIRQGLMSWKEARRKEHSVQTRRGGRKKLVKTRVAHTSLRFYRTA